MKLANNKPGQRLSAAKAAKDLPYHRESVTPGIVHLGVGAFHRAHMAAYIDDILAIDPSWGIIGASLRRPDTSMALRPQDFLYTLIVRDGAGTRTRTIGALLDVIDAGSDRDALIAALIDPRIRVVSLTVTEKGYCHDPATGEIDPEHPDIRHDLATPAGPISVPGIITRALELRRASGTMPFTVLSCDNLPANGETTARIVVGFAALLDPGLAEYIAREVAFPSTMVDRIVPATTDADRDAVLAETGLSDAWPVVTEPFTQWVVEDHFPTGRPPLEVAGAQFAKDVRPFELMKLRMLNGSHSILAYLGYLAGYDYVSDVVADPSFRHLIHDFMTDEVIATLPTDIGDLAAYRDSLLDRFSNPALKHRTWQIAMDGSQKLPQRLLGTIRHRLALGFGIDRAALGIAAWMRYVSGIDEQDKVIDVRDPLASRLRTISDAAEGNAARTVANLLTVREVFGDDLRESRAFSDAVCRHYEALKAKGAAAVVKEFQGLARK